MCSVYSRDSKETSVIVKMWFKGGWEEKRKQVYFYSDHSGSSLGSRL